MTWFWLNIPLAALFFLAVTMIPLWLVIRHPDTRSGAAAPARGAVRAAAVAVASHPAAPSWTQAELEDAAERELVGAGR